MARPKNSTDPDRAAADEVMARTVWQLLAWGYTLRGPHGAAQTVAILAREVLKVQSPDGYALSGRTIEENFDRWSKTATRATGWATRPTMAVGKPWSGHSVDYLRSLGPQGLLLKAIAGRLLECGGTWPDAIPRFAERGDPQMTEGAYRQHLATGLFPERLSDDGEEIGAENPG